MKHFFLILLALQLNFTLPALCLATQNDDEHEVTKKAVPNSESLAAAKSKEEPKSDLTIENFKPVPEKIPGFSIEKVDSTLAVMGNVPSAKKENLEKKELPLWSLIDVKSPEGLQFQVLFNHFTGQIVGPGGGDEAFGQKYYSPQGYSAKQARELCAQLPPAGSWRLPEALEAADFFRLQIYSMWQSLGPQGWPQTSLVTQNAGADPKDFQSYTPQKKEGSGLLAKVAAINDINLGGKKFKCIFNAPIAKK